ncbi:Hypothetical protein R9X50_00011100 [Acrodontium crateriforme]|uniref:Uncharacterized protein n=1 Tax=Acrodontium crateriforme TaxID=150365 RepID=A0AAQ3LZR3_9PEZI|nr:Hypothetical protein R9X50_00011100 [Acrodontium crateriforme]
MAGNPFRRSVLGNARPDNNDAYAYTNGASPWTDGFGSDDASAQTPSPPRKPAGKKKRVTIQTPPHSPEEAPARLPPRRLSEGRTDSPPPQDFFSELGRENVALSSAPSPADLELRQAAMNTSQNSGPLSTPDSLLPSAPVAGTGGKAPYNPFARTLATSEAAYESSKTNDVDEESEDEVSRPARRPMDVDAFKNILLTGSAVPSPPSGAVPTSLPTLPARDSISKKDLSSRNHPAGFTSSANPPQATSPSAAYEHSQPNSDSFSPRSPSLSSEDGNQDPKSDSEHEYENSSLMGSASSRPQEIAPPAPPKSRVPQTVSFADFDNAVSSPSNASALPDVSSTSQEHNHHSASSLLRPGLERTGSNLNKPLPHAPDVDTLEKKISNPSIGSEAVPPALNDERQPPRQPQQKKGPPPPPPASRRQGQASGTPSRARSASGSSNRKHEGELQPLTSSAGTPPVESGNKSSPAPPPPPPSRRAQVAIAPSSASNADSFSSSDPPVSNPVPPSQLSTSTEAKPTSIPPPPPRRTMSKSSSPANRTPSTASRNSIQRNDASIPATGTPNPPSGPPVPPPRRAASKRDSALLSNHTPIPSSAYTKSARRQSAHSIGSEGSASFISIPHDANEHKPSPYSKPTDPIQEHQEEKPNERDILADMSAFQAEIDALRAHGGR